MITKEEIQAMTEEEKEEFLYDFFDRMCEKEVRRVFPNAVWLNNGVYTDRTCFVFLGRSWGACMHRKELSEGLATIQNKFKGRPSIQ